MRIARKQLRDRPRNDRKFLRSAALQRSIESIKRQWAIGILHDRNPVICEDFIVLDILTALVGRDQLELDNLHRMISNLQRSVNCLISSRSLVLSSDNV
jgi:hypothetical protein